MRDPRWITLLFDLFVRLVGAGRFTRATGPVLAVVVSGTVIMQWPAGPEDISLLLPTLSEVRHVIEEVAPEPVAAPSVAAKVTAKIATAPVVEAAVPNRPLTLTPMRTDSKTPRVVLDKEQANLAQFIASRYRVAIESTQLFVDGAYKTAREYKMDPWLLLAVMAVESSFDPDAASHKGAHGLMQVLTRVHAEKFAPFGGVAAAFDPIANIKVGARILRDYITRDGSVEGGLKAYVGAALMSDDRGYGFKVLAERERLAAVATGKPLAAPLVTRPADTPSRASSDKDAADESDSKSRARDAILELLGTMMSSGAAASAGGNAAAGPTQPTAPGGSTAGTVASSSSSSSSSSSMAVPGGAVLASEANPIAGGAAQHPAAYPGLSAGPSAGAAAVTPGGGTSSVSAGPVVIPAAAGIAEPR